MRRLLYAIHDYDSALKERGAFRVSDLDQARDLNKLGYGIYWTVSSFHGDRRRLAELDEVYYYFVETDKIPKSVVIEKIASTIRPSLVIETKNGFHIYYRCADKPTRLEYRAVNERLIHFFGGDKGVKDETRLLRVPGFLHQKDPKQPFMVSLAYRSDFVYTGLGLYEYFRLPEVKEAVLRGYSEVREAVSTVGGVKNEKLWDYFNTLHCGEALRKLSGTPAVMGEVYDFRANPGGTWQIIVNGKRSQNWIDADGYIGSHSKGGPTIFQWLKWYGRSNKEVVDLLKQYFPEGFEVCKQS